ncbi:MAG TPA: hypothetical protein DF296_13625 [Candidatus Margulisbacteria bacterium]|nr:hypothetical protein [Candidatus Margulisiibacteriota bacterium]
MLKLTIEDYYIPPEKEEKPKTPAFQVREISYKNDKQKLWFLNDEKKTLEYLQRNSEPDEWLEMQKRIDDLEFQIFSIFAWKKKSFTDRKFSKSAKEL